MPTYRPTLKILSQVTANKLFFKDGLNTKIDSLQDKFDVSCVANSSVQELLRGIRQQMDSLISLPEKEMSAMALGLAHR